MKLSDLIRNTQDRPLIAVQTPEWGAADGKLFVRKLSPIEKHGLWDGQHTLSVPDRGTPFVAYVVSVATFDANGARAFSDDDRDWLATEKASEPVDRLFRAIDDANIITARAEEESKKNSVAPGSCESISP